jgi:hypothetical protein
MPSTESMADNIPAKLQEKLAARLGFYGDLGLHLFYRRRIENSITSDISSEPIAVLQAPPIESVIEDLTLAKSSRKTESKNRAAPVPAAPAASVVLPVASVPSLFEAVEKVLDDNLLRIRTDLGDCTRCKLHRTRKSIVYGDGNPKAELVFVGEGPGADEDEQGLPFVGQIGRAHV